MCELVLFYNDNLLWPLVNGKADSASQDNGCSALLQGKKCRNGMLHHALFLHRFSSCFFVSWAKWTNILHVHTTLCSWSILGCTHTFHIPFWGIGTINCMTIKCSLNTRIQIRVRFQQHVSEFECHFPGPMLLLPCWIVSGQSDTRIYVQECDEMLLTHLIQPQLVFIVECNL
jgi:hypothetical protein